MYPFEMSSKSVITAKDVFPVLRTFVAPILPEPIFLISILLKTLERRRPRGIEPHMYEKKITKKISLVN